MTGHRDRYTSIFITGMAALLCLLANVQAGAQANPEHVRSEVIIDLGDRQAITGQTEIAFAWGEHMSPPRELMRGVINLREAMNRWTQVQTGMSQNLMLSSPAIMRMPFVFVSTENVFDLTETEKQNLRTYFESGGFMFLDNAQPLGDFSASGASLQQMMRDVLPGARFAPVPNSHAIYASFFAFTDGPPQGAEVGRTPTGTLVPERFYLEGIWLNDALVAVYSDMGYIVKWNDTSNNEPQLRMGVNLIVYALMKDNSLASRTYR